MSTVEEHYSQHLAPVYVWMAGGLAAALSRGESELAAVLEERSDAGTAVDLGAGFGMHAIPLARRGYSVLAIDSSAMLLDLIREQADAAGIRTVAGDLLSFPKHLNAPPDLILCMGDTLTHLPDLASVERLFSSAAEALRAGGTFVLSFRDYSSPLTEERRFIPVQSDNARILTCFLEYHPEHVIVHDLLHERTGATWGLRVSAYRKIRLSPEWVVRSLEARGFTVRREAGLSGMVRIVAQLSPATQNLS